MPHRSSSRNAPPESVAARWVVELERWAMVREKVLAQLDIEGAKRARTLARDIKKLGKAVAAAREGSDPDREQHVSELAGMLAEVIAHAARLIGPLLERRKTPPRSMTPRASGAHAGARTDVARIELVKRPKRTTQRRKPVPR